MILPSTRIIAVSIMLAALCAPGAALAGKVVIAHRGASGYLPEHSLPAKAAAHAMGADYIEQDLIMTRDGQIVVLHDLHLDRVTDVADVFPGRRRPDGHYYTIDFDLAELKRLRLTEGVKRVGGETQAVYPRRFPPWRSIFRISTLAEELELIQGMNHSTGRVVGIYPEIKAPWFHRHEGQDISTAVLIMLKQYGYLRREDPIYLQCFDPRELRRLRTELMPAMGMDLKLVQLIGETRWRLTMVIENGQPVPYDYEWMKRPAAMVEIARYADGVGPWMNMLVHPDSLPGNPQISGLTAAAHAAGLEVHPYTFRLDPGRLPSYASDFEDLLAIFFFQVGVDGVFTDYPDRAAQFLKAHQPRR
ncbi:MAG: glycerophosphodiester phosphodiesterase [Desulfobacterales bacterium]|nr:glycerophosphodiester phosphodiesterase [Desulfobacterales bacterium]